MRRCGCCFLWRTLEPILDGQAAPTRKDAEEDTEGAEPALAWSRARSRPAGRVFRAWLLIYGAVGAQMGWLLRPFIGSPNREFQWFRERDSNFLPDLVQTLMSLGS